MMQSQFTAVGPPAAEDIYVSGLVFLCKPGHYPKNWKDISTSAISLLSTQLLPEWKVGSAKHINTRPFHCAALPLSGLCKSCKPKWKCTNIQIVQTKVHIHIYVQIVQSKFVT